MTVSILRGLGQQLIQIHGQHDSAQLFDEANHLSLLDAFAEHGELMERYRNAFMEMDGIRKRIRSLQMDAAEKARRMENLTFQIQEITRAELKPGEDQELEDKRKLMRSGEKLMTALSEASQALYGGDDADGAVTLVSQAQRSLGMVADVSDAMGEAYQQVTELQYSLVDAAERVRDLRNSFDFSPSELEAVESRLDVIHRLRRKYGATCEDILAYQQRCQKELDEMQLADDTIAQLQSQFRVKAKAAKALAAELTASRRQAAQQFEARLISELRQLDMPRVQFVCELTPLRHLEETGGDACRFMMSANIGEELRQNLMNELGKISRIIDRELPDADKEVLLVIDGTTGQNGLLQAKQFREIAGVTGMALTKLDGTAKGGIVIAVADSLQIPVKYIGVGEGMEDLMPFEARGFVDALI